MMNGRQRDKMERNVANLISQQFKENKRTVNVRYFSSFSSIPLQTFLFTFFLVIGLVNGLNSFIAAASKVFAKKAVARKGLFPIKWYCLLKDLAYRGQMEWN